MQSEKECVTKNGNPTEKGGGMKERNRVRNEGEKRPRRFEGN